MKTKIFIMAFFLSQIALSQSIKKSSIDNGGASVTNTNLKLVYTIGEVNVQEVTVGNISISEGFITPNLLSSGIFIPDANFEQALIDLGIDSDGRVNRQISRSDAEGVLSLNVSDPIANPNLPKVDAEIADLTGIEGFINLKSLDCSDNLLTELDLTSNTFITSLVCHTNGLTALDISNNSDLVQIYCYHNEIPSLVVSHMTSLERLWCYSNNLEELDVSNNLELQELMCHNNDLSSLDVTNNTSLTRLECYANQLHELDVSKNIELFWIACGVNPLTNLDFTNNTKLTRLESDLADLLHIDMRNGNNHNMNKFVATINPDLSCISVDNELADHSSWIVDSNHEVIFSNDCGYNTQRGIKVLVSPMDRVIEKKPVKVSFDKVDASGQTTLEISNTVEDPGGLTFPDDPTVYNVETTAEFLGPVDLTIDYSGQEFENEDGLRLLHYDAGEWKDITTLLDAGNKKITGKTFSLSPFIIIEDWEPPVLIGVPEANITVECDEVPAPPDVSAEDNVDGNVEVTSTETREDDSCPNIYTLTRTWTASDDFGNTAYGSQTITVTDNRPPDILGLPDQDFIQNNDPGQCGALVDLSFISATDKCSNPVNLSFSPPQGSLFPVGLSLVTVTAMDACDNTAEASFNVVIEDTEIPVLACPADIIVNNDQDQCGAIVTYADPIVTDNCSGVFTDLTTGLRSGALFQVGTTTETFTSTDKAGNIATCSFTVTVIDTESPLITRTPEPLVLWPPNHKYRTVNVSDFVGEVGDNCSPLSLFDVVITQVTSDEPEDAHGKGDGHTLDDIVLAQDCQSVDLRVERQGKGNGRVYTIFARLIDESGNTGSTEYQVHIPESIKKEPKSKKKAHKSKKKGHKPKKKGHKPKNENVTDDGAAYIVEGCGDGNVRIAIREVQNENPKIFDDISVYPNPVREIVTIEFPVDFVNEKESIEVHLFNLVGVDMIHDNQRFVHSNKLDIDMKDLPAGIYLLMIPNKETILKYKLSKL